MNSSYGMVMLRDADNVQASIISVTQKGGQAAVEIGNFASGKSSCTLPFSSACFLLNGVPLKGLDLRKIIAEKQSVRVDIRAKIITEIRIGPQKVAKLPGTLTDIHTYCNAKSRNVPEQIKQELIRRACAQSAVTNQSLLQLVTVQQLQQTEQVMKPKTIMPCAYNVNNQLGVIVALDNNRGVVECQGVSTGFPITAVYLFGIPANGVDLRTVLYIKQQVKVDIVNGHVKNVWIGPQREMLSINQLTNLIDYCKKRTTPVKYMQKLQDTLITSVQHTALPYSNDTSVASYNVDKLLDLSAPLDDIESCNPLLLFNNTFNAPIPPVQKELIDLDDDWDESIKSGKASSIDLDKWEPFDYDDDNTREIVTLGKKKDDGSSSDEDKVDDNIMYEVSVDKSETPSYEEWQLELASFLEANNVYNGCALATMFAYKWNQNHKHEAAPSNETTTKSSRNKTSQTTSTGNILMKEIFHEGDDKSVGEEDW